MIAGQGIQFMSMVLVCTSQLCGSGSKAAELGVLQAPLSATALPHVNGLVECPCWWTGAWTLDEALGTPMAKQGSSAGGADALSSVAAPVQPCISNACAYAAPRCMTALE